jgi:hypothetical protein
VTTRFVLYSLALVASVQPLAGQSQSTTVLNWWAEDSARAANLRMHGLELRRAGIVVWAPKDSLDQRWLTAFSDTLATAIAELRSLIGGPHPWQRTANRPLQFYLSPGRFVSHTDGNDRIFISVSRVRQGAPFVHEAAHELLSPRAPFWPDEYGDSSSMGRAEAVFPFWLIEGLPDYLAQVVAASTGFNEGDVFGIGGLAKVDSACAARLAASNRRDEIRERVGRNGRLQALVTTERPQVAPVYYACSQSFTKHLADRVGVANLVAIMQHIPNGTWRSVLETAAGVTLERMREEWLAGIERKAPNESTYRRNYFSL